MSKRRHAEDEDEAPFKMKRGGVLAPPAGSDIVNRKSHLKAHIIALNGQFASWVNRQNNQRVEELWTEGVRDYLKFVEELLRDFKDVVPTEGGAPPLAFNGFGAADMADKPKAPSFLTTSAAMEPAGGSTAFTFGGAQKTSDSFGAPAETNIFGKAPFGSAAGASKEKPALNFGGPSDKPAAGAFSFGKAAAGGDDGGSGEQPVAKKVAFSFGGGGEGADPDASAKPFSFGGSASGAAASGGAFSFGGAAKGEAAGAKASTAAPFSFGSAAALTAAGSAPFSFGGAPAAAASGASGGLFSFGAAPGSGAAGAGAGAAGGEDEGEEDAPNKFESEVEVNAESGSVAFKAKAKFNHLVKDPDTNTQAWEGKGVGTLMLRTPPESADGKPGKPFVTFTTEAGRVLYIANVLKTMKCLVGEKQPTVTFSAPWSPDGESPPTLQGVMFKLPKGKETDFLSELEKLQAGME